jgi:hypothetical protein
VDILRDGLVKLTELGMSFRNKLNEAHVTSLSQETEERGESDSLGEREILAQASKEPA